MRIETEGEGGADVPFADDQRRSSLQTQHSRRETPSFEHRHDVVGVPPDVHRIGGDIGNRQELGELANQCGSIAEVVAGSQLRILDSPSLLTGNELANPAVDGDDINLAGGVDSEGGDRAHVSHFAPDLGVGDAGAGVAE